MKATDEMMQGTVRLAGDTSRDNAPSSPEYQKQRDREFRRDLAEARGPISDDPMGEVATLAAQYAAEDFERWLIRMPRSAPESVYQLLREERLGRLMEVVGTETVEFAIEKAFERELRTFAEPVRGFIDAETVEQFVAEWDDESARKIFAAYDHMKECEEAVEGRISNRG